VQIHSCLAYYYDHQEQGEGQPMSDFESDYSDYDIAKENEDGLHSGRSNPSRQLVKTLGIVVGLLILFGIALSLIP
jgi:hypothetical protein